jgi:DNA-binding MarR family transcriptional regulator
MQTENRTELALPADQLSVMRLARLAPRPTTIANTGLSQELLVDLVAKYFLERGNMTLSDLAQASALSGGILERLLDFMRAEALTEVRPTHGDRPGLTYGLTDRGRAAALDAMLRSGYVGPAPVPLAFYADIVRAQSIHKHGITREAMHRAFHDTVIDQSLLDRLGSSVNSGRAIFLYGAAGTGKTFISQRLARVFPGLILVPHAIEVNNQVVQVFDPLLHKTVDVDIDDVHIGRGHDRRFVICERPCVLTAGELTANMLEVMYEPSTKLYEAPLQMRANNGIFIIDDLGRQRIEPKQLFNRWIVPLEEQRDYLNLTSGRHFSIPFDVVLVFSTNIHPLELADEAFLRRLGYKIEFQPMSPDAYARIWRDTCMELDVEYDPLLLRYVINDLHGKNHVDLLPCHPRDLISMAVDHSVYVDNDRYIDKEKMRWAWRNYFVSLRDFS